MGPSAVTDLDRFTELELAEMHVSISKRVLANYEEAERIYTNLYRIPYPSEEYTQAKLRANVAADAGQEGHALLRDISAKLEAIRSARRANADA